MAARVVTVAFEGVEARRVDVEVSFSRGDFAFVPAWAIHAEGNLGAEAAEVVLARSTPEAIFIDLPELRVPEDLLRAGSASGNPEASG